MTTPKLPSAEELAKSLHDGRLPCPMCVDLIRADRRAVLEAAAKVVKRREVENGTAAEGEGEPWFSIYTHTEAQLHNAVGDIRKLMEEVK